MVEVQKMKVENYMTSNIITVQQDIYLPDAINIMATKGIGNLIVHYKSNNYLYALSVLELFG